jgi:putative pyruvate formate lyase activating enzyme
MTGKPLGDVVPGYRKLFETGELVARAAEAHRRLANCDLCPRYCLVDRTATIRGTACRTGANAVVQAYGPHFGEESPLSGTGGSGTIFFSYCNMRCLYCQNWEISWQGEGVSVDDDALAAMMLSVQRRGCHNVNLVSPSHVVAQILSALVVAARRGLTVPLVYNTGGYDSPEALRLLDGVIDIYMPDMKYGDDARARRYSKVQDYIAVNRSAVREMHRQVGDLVLDDRGRAVRGLLVRHLVLPDGLADTAGVLRFLADEVSPATYVNVMGQYRPCYRAVDYPELTRHPTAAEMQQAFATAERLGLHRQDGRGTVR